MSSPAVILVVLTGGFILGVPIVVLFLSGTARVTLNTLFAALILGIIVTGWQALLLAEFGRFSLPLLTAVWLLTLLSFSFLAWRRWHAGRVHVRPPAIVSGDGAFSQLPRARLIKATLLLIWAVAAVWLFFRPHEAIMGGADAGVYVSLGAQIARSGGFQISDPALAAVDPAFAALALRPLPANPVAHSYLVPGFYVGDAATGLITPQFYPLHPLWQAVAFSLAAPIIEGIYAELLLNGLWMLLASLAIFMTARELGGWLTGVLALLGLSFLALQVWFARYPTTEALTQCLTWAGLWATVMWLGGRRPAALWAFLAGAGLGSVFLVRIDVLTMLPVLALFLLALWARGWRRSDWWFALPLGLLVVQSLLHGQLLSAPYFYEHVGFGLLLLWRNWLILLGGLVLAIAFLVVVYVFRGRFAALSPYRRPFLASLIAAVLLFALYGWFIRPATGTVITRPDSYSETLIPLTNHENWLRLGWYFSPIGIWLGVLGVALMLWRAGWKTALLLGVGCLFAAIYLWNVRANPHQIYVMRRYVPVVAPFFILASAYLLGDLLSHLHAWRAQGSWMQALATLSGVILSIAWLGGLAWSARGFISQVDHQGVVDQLAALEAELPPDSVLLFNDQAPVGRGDFWGTPLKFIYGHDVFTLRSPPETDSRRLAQTINSWQNSGRTVVWIGDPAWLAENGFDFQEQVHVIESRRLEGSYEHKPREIVQVQWVLPTAPLERTQ